MSAEPCVELDGCCATHSACFRKGLDEEGPCEGWPCPRAEQRATRVGEWSTD